MAHCNPMNKESVTAQVNEFAIRDILGGDLRGAEARAEIDLCFTAQPMETLQASFLEVLTHHAPSADAYRGFMIHTISEYLVRNCTAYSDRFAATPSKFKIVTPVKKIERTTPVKAPVAEKTEMKQSPPVQQPSVAHAPVTSTSVPPPVYSPVPVPAVDSAVDFPTLEAAAAAERSERKSWADTTEDAERKKAADDAVRDELIAGLNWSDRTKAASLSTDELKALAAKKNADTSSDTASVSAHDESEDDQKFAENMQSVMGPSAAAKKAPDAPKKKANAGSRTGTPKKLEYDGTTTVVGNVTVAGGLPDGVEWRKVVPKKPAQSAGKKESTTLFSEEDCYALTAVNKESNRVKTVTSGTWWLAIMAGMKPLLPDSKDWYAQVLDEFGCPIRWHIIRRSENGIPTAWKINPNSQFEHYLAVRPDGSEYLEHVEKIVLPSGAEVRKRVDVKYVLVLLCPTPLKEKLKGLFRSPNAKLML